MDETRAHELHHQVWDAIRLGGDVQARVIELIAEVGLNEICEIYALWVGSTVGLFNIMSSVETGMRMDASQLSGTRALVRQYAVGRDGEGITELQKAYQHLSDGRADELGAAFGRVWATDARSAADMLVIAMLVLRAGMTMHGVPLPRMALRAASLRTYLADTRNAIKNADWCGGCLPKAAEVLALTDDRKETVPLDGTVKRDDLSFLDGIDLGGFDGGTESTG